jgi:hypothetical protein
MSSSNATRKAKRQRERENRAIAKGAQVLKYRERTAGRGRVNKRGHLEGNKRKVRNNESK